MLEQNILMIIKLILSTRIIWAVFIKTLKNAIQVRNVNY